MNRYEVTMQFAHPYVLSKTNIGGEISAIELQRVETCTKIIKAKNPDDASRKSKKFLDGKVKKFIQTSGVSGEEESISKSAKIVEIRTIQPHERKDVRFGPKFWGVIIGIFLLGASLGGLIFLLPWRS